jgi:hypothetical protein
MPYNPGVSYQGGQFLFQGLSQMGQGIEEGTFKAIQRMDEQQKEQQMLNEAVQAASMINDPNTGKPYFGVEDMAKFQAGSLAQKRAMGAKAIAAWHSNELNRQAAYQNAQIQNIYSEIGARKAEEDFYKKGPTAMQVPIPGTNVTQAMVRTGPRSFEKIDIGAKAPAGKNFWDGTVNGQQVATAGYWSPQEQTKAIKEATSPDVDRQALAMERMQKNVQGLGVTMDQLANRDEQHAAKYEGGKLVNAPPDQATHVYYGPYTEDPSKLPKLPIQQHDLWSKKVQIAQQGLFQPSTTVPEAKAETKAAPAVGTTGTVNGVPAVWDGKGWKRAAPAAAPPPAAARFMGAPSAPSAPPVVPSATPTPPVFAGPVPNPTPSAGGYAPPAMNFGAAPTGTPPPQLSPQLQALMIAAQNGDPQAIATLKQMGY